MRDQVSDAGSLVANLKRNRFLTTGVVEKALRAVSMEPFLPDAYSPLAYVDAPVPFFESDGVTATTLSPRLVTLLLEAAELDAGHDVLIHGGKSGYIAALAAKIAKRGRVVLVDENPGIRERTQKALDALGITNASVEASFDVQASAFDRIIITSPVVVTALPKRALRDYGLLIAPVRTASPNPGFPAAPKASRAPTSGAPPGRKPGVDFTRILRSGDEWAELRFGETLFPPPQAPSRWRGAAGAERTLSGLWLLEESLREAWSDKVKDDASREFHEVVEKTIGAGLLSRGIARSDPAKARVATGAFHMAYVYQMTGDPGNAADCYTASTKTVPTSEAYTFRGWAESFSGDYDAAIEDCQLAIATDPAFGNPYNDIGAYLIELGRPAEAIAWFERALAAERYDSPFFPHANLGRVHMMLGEKERARSCFEKALAINPAYEPARRLLETLEKGGVS